MGSILLCLYFIDYKWYRNLFEDMEKKKEGERKHEKKIQNAKY